MSLFRRGPSYRTDPLPVIHTRSQSIHPDRPYWVVTDHAVFGTFLDSHQAVALADLVARTQRLGERVMVTHWGPYGLTTFYRTAGQGKVAA